MADLRAYAREAAIRAGCDPDLFARQIDQESGFDPEAFNSVSGASGIAQIVARFHPGVDPWDPLASLDYAAGWMARMRRQYGSYRRALAAYNWGPGNVASWDGRRETLPGETRRYLDVILGPGWPEPGGTPAVGDSNIAMQQLRVTDDGVRLRERPDTSAPILAELAAGTLVVPITGYAWRQVRIPNGREGWMALSYLEAAPGEISPPSEPAARYTFDPATPTYLQRLKYTCAVASTIWLLRSIGISVTPEEAHDAMVGPYVDARGDDGVGLLDASGAGIVEVLRERWGVTAFNRAPVSFDEAAGWAGTCPLAIGGRNWGHWTAVRGYDGERLVLANPAGTGPRYGQQALGRQQFADLGWFSAVVVPLS